MHEHVWTVTTAGWWYIALGATVTAVGITITMAG
jgi:hypothetical protein